MAEMFDSPWLVAGFAFIVGLFVGWMVWGGPWRDGLAPGNGAASGDAAAAMAGKRLFDETAGLDGNLKTAIAELKAAKALLEKTDDIDAAMTEELDKLDQAVKRANGRLKLMSKSSERAADAD